MVAVVAVLQRLGLENRHPRMIATSAVASAAEAVLGALLLRRLGFDGRFEQLRDLLALFATALVAPLASIIITMYGWAIGGGLLEVGFHSGWFGWWRMNSIGILTVVPLVVTWAQAARRTTARAPWPRPPRSPRA